ncbi:MAG TPA: DUF4349 domain-containing protein [Solirubrobacteraceae bacterium]|jgi:hypothetical protein|nr:DUF4349 domain-containing protein [Solirubrobacteraceae bacterium]
MRQRDPLSLDEARELDALERALAGDPVDADLRELEDLVHDIRATAPQMTPGFAARLEHELAEGLPQPREAPPARRAPRRWLLLPAAGSLAAAAVAVVVVLGQQDSPDRISELASKPPPALADRARSSGTADRSSSSARESAPAGGAPSSAGGNAAVAPAPSAPNLPQSAKILAKPKVARKIERSADLVLRVSTRSVASTSEGVIRTVDRFGGIVASSTSSSDDSTGEATLDLRIPTARLDDALAALSRLGHVAERRQNLVDITGSFTSAQDRLSDARSERRGLLRALGRASTEQQIDSLRAHLRNVRSQIARLNGNLDALRRRADLSRVSVTVRGDGSAAAADDTGSGSWSPGDAARDAVRVLEVMAGALLIALAVAAPLALLAALAALGVRAGRRRRREGALDAA